MYSQKNHTIENIMQCNNVISEINSYYQILAPIQFTLESCSGTEESDYVNFVLTSPGESYFYHFQNGNEIHQFNNRVPHFHDFYELLIVLDGEIQQQIENTTIVFRSGSCCLMNRNIIHKEVFHSKANILFIGLSERIIRDLIEDEKNNYFQKVSDLTINPVIKFMIDNLNKADTKEYLDFLPSINNINWCHTLHNLTDRILRAILSPQLGSTYIIKGMLLELIEYLSSPEQFHITPVHINSDADFLLFSHIGHLMEETNGRLSRSELEKTLHYSGNYLNSIVRRYTGLCLFDYGMTFCMKKAASLLQASSLSISEIMDTLKFNNTTHFYKCFEKHYHMTPKQYRIQSRSKVQNQDKI
ncbi:MAG: AraC family transcriptional regulator [Lachnospiraceae bacterium]|nr:AraC family transcriptional regulator [Lachnospiraceae bacterium]